MSAPKRVYAFGGATTEGNKSMKFILGGKGANLAEMAKMGLPVPPGFTISCQACMEYYNATPPALPEGLAEEIAEHIAALEAKMGKTLGDDNDPLLVSVRSGSPFSMPGMMDTVLEPRPERHVDPGPHRARPATSASRGTATAASSRCSPRSSSTPRATCSRTPSTR